MLGAGALGLPRGMVWGGRREQGSGWGTHVYLWWIHFDIWQNQYNIVKLKNKIKLKKQKQNSVCCYCCCCYVALVVSDSVRPHRWQPTRLPIPGILQARTPEWV